MIAHIAAYLVGALVSAQPPAPAPSPSTPVPTVFFAQYGDPTHGYDRAVGSVDRFDSYTAPPCFREALQDRTLADTDNAESPAGRWYPFVLSGYPSFLWSVVRSAVLRVDFYYEHRADYASDTIAFFDDAACKFVRPGAPGLLPVAPLRARLAQRDRDRNQWISLHFDLITGDVFAAEIDRFGVPRPDGDYGRLDVLDTADALFNSDWARDILKAAADGTLQGRTGPDCRLSYVALTGTADRAPTEERLDVSSIAITFGTAAHPEPDRLRAADRSHVTIQARPAMLAAKAEYTATFVLPARLAAGFAFLELELDGSSNVAGAGCDIAVLNPATGEFVPVGTQEVPPTSLRMRHRVPGEARLYLSGRNEITFRIGVTRNGVSKTELLTKGFSFSSDLLSLIVLTNRR